MWPYTDEELGWLNRPRPAIGRSTPIGSDLVAYYVAEGRRLRAEAIARFARRAFRALPRVPTLTTALVGGRRATAPDDVAAAHLLRTPLTSIRSSSEILRDYPDMPLDQRARFLDVIVQESERLTQAIHQVLAGADPTHGRLPHSAKAGRP